MRGPRLLEPQIVREMSDCKRDIRLQEDTGWAEGLPLLKCTNVVRWASSIIMPEYTLG